MPSQTDIQPVRTEILEQHIATGVARNALTLRTVVERLDEIVALLTPKPGEGPTLDEMLARLIELVTDQTVLLKRIDDRTTILLADSRASGGGGTA